MKQLLASAAVSLALGTGVAFAQTQEQAPDPAQEPAATAGVTECQVVSPDLNARLAEEPQLRAEFTPQLSRDLRYMRNVAMQLERYGHTEACDAVAAAMQEMIDNPEEYQQIAARSQIEGEGATGLGIDPEMTWEERQEVRREAAVPIEQYGSRLRAGDLIGADVRGRTGSSLGEVDDLVFGEQAEDSYIIVSYGGFLGFGQDLSAVPLTLVEVTPDLDTIYVPLDQDQLEDAPTFSRGDEEVINDPDWQERNRQFYTQAQ
ncbi:MAG TPA: PRC-barrel domain-containing protein [Kiloniellales bacterium]|nr:PRC-barrel domain-containing protein [Kiloniellales bacterium]